MGSGEKKVLTFNLEKIEQVAEFNGKKSMRPRYTETERG